MPRISVSRVTNAEPETVWDLMTLTRLWSSWGLSIRDHVGPESITHGSEGRVITILGFGLGYRITEFVPGRRWTWTVAGVEATHHELDVVDTDGHRRVVVRFGAPWWAVAYLPVLWWSLRSLVERAEREQPDRASLRGGQQ